MTQKSQKEFFGIIIPANLLNNSEITLSEKFVYAYISSFKKYCCESNERISEKLGISQKTISRSISNLQKLGYIFIDCEKSNNFGRKLYAVYENPQKLEYLSKRNVIFEHGQNVHVENPPKHGQNVQEPRQNVHATYRVNMDKMSNKEYRIKRIKETRVENSPAGLAGSVPASRLSATSRPKRENFSCTKDFIVAVRNWNKRRSVLTTESQTIST